ncbi:MAG: type III pantothenate kinase [Oscillospiraceae bacterium]|nr:type III pantothenate kinase [Oscillospiraceae bacterium]
MLLAIDIGNTNILIGGLKDGNIVFKARIATDRTRTSDQYGVEIKNMIEAFGAKLSDISDCIISSVVPPVFNSVCTGVIKIIGKQPMVVGPGLKTGLNIHVDVPSQVGSDRIVIAVAALAEYKTPLILIDMGTATTIEVVEPENVYLGGVIFPGVKVSLDALTSRAAQLPGISLDKPRNVIGKNTIDCMRSGTMYGNAAMIDGIVDRIEEELGHKSTLIATGGLAQFITPLCKRKIIVEKDLLLKGLYILYQKNKK